jgi:hypothetical protein
MRHHRRGEITPPGLAILIALGLWIGPATAGAQVRPSTTDDTPPRVVQIGVEERIRTENWNNIVDHSDASADARKQWRFRTRIWASVPFGAHLEFHAGLNSESRLQTTPWTPFKLDEAIVETLYADVRLGTATTIRAGRQDVMRGEGFVLLEGTPLDGSRSTYVNGIDLAHQIVPGSRIEFLALFDPRTDTYLPVVVDVQKPLVDGNERIAGVYYTDTRRAGTDLQAYYLHKQAWHDRDLILAGNRLDRSTSTLGGRVALSVGSKVTATGEFAGQWGHERAGAAVRAWGGYVNVRRTFAHPWKPTVQGGYVVLSGDDTTTPTNEGWDPVVSRWPKWSELYIYSQVPENGVSYWTNLQMWQAEVTCAPVARTTVRGTYYHMAAFHPFAGSAAIFAAGATRGDLVEGRVDVVLNRAVKAHVLYERLVPGSFYVGRRPGYFFRVEFTFTHEASIPLGR